MCEQKITKDRHLMEKAFSQLKFVLTQMHVRLVASHLAGTKNCVHQRFEIGNET